MEAILRVIILMAICKSRSFHTNTIEDVLKTCHENPNVTMLISSHDLIHVTEVAQRVVLLEKEMSHGSS
jgi:ABC-type Mn2+/Zn2+ transport system ATPase subunit